MKLIKMELNGFKSFSDKVLIDFSKDGITIFIGPNGCGKSNIVDALRWAMGEQSIKNLRGGSMADVIFSGTKTRAPSGFCQVSLSFANQKYASKLKYQDLDEIVVTRRLYQDGQSEYLINKQRCRLSDVRDLFIDTGLGAGSGYSIVEQGSIGAIITNRPQDRRHLIEEAAGIVKFKIKKKEAEKKLAATKQNLLRINDVLLEVRRQEKDLSDQAQQAKKYFDARSKVEQLENFIHAKQWQLANDKEVNLRQTLANNQTDATDIKLTIQNLEADITNRESQITEAEQAIESLRRQLEVASANRQSIVSDIKLKQQQQQDALKWYEKGKSETANYKESIAGFKKDIAKLEDKILRFDKDKADIIKTLEDCQTQINNINESLSSQTAKLSRLNREKSELLTAKNRTEALLETSSVDNQTMLINNLDKDLLNSENKHAALVEKIDNLNTKQQLRRHNISDDEDEISNTASQVRACHARLKEFKRRHVLLTDALAKKSATKEKFTLQYDMFKKKILPAADFLKHLISDKALADQLGFLGLFKDFLLIKNPNASNTEQDFYINSVNNFYNMAIFSQHSRLPALIAACKKYQVNQLTFTFIDVNPAVLNTAGLPEYVDFKLHNVNKTINNILTSSFDIESEYLAALGEDKNRFSQQLGVLVYIQDLDAVSRQRESQLLSDISNLQIWITARTAAKNQLDAKIDDLAKSSADYQSKLDALKDSLSNLRSDLKVDDNMLNRLAYEKQETAALIKKQTTELVNLKNELARSDSLQDEYSSKINELTTQLTEKVALIKQAAFEEAGLKSLKEQHLQKLHEIKISLNNTENEIKSHKQLVFVINQQLSGIQTELANIEHSQTDKNISPQNYADEIASLTKLAAESEAKISDLSLNLDEKRQHYQLLKDKLAKQEHDLKDKFNILNRLESDNNILLSKIDHLCLEKDKITSDLFEFKKLTPPEVLQNFDHKNFDLKIEYGNLKNLKIQLAGMDDVNLSAQGDYEKVAERLLFLEAQNTDLINSVDLLEKSINKINKNSQRMFEEAFHAINEKFQTVFPTLFGGGSAYLELIDDKNILDTGIEIKVSPPGKALKNINLLSGGEKALTAAALIVAIFLYKPSPFCVLDEVDAPLDINNVRRFCKMIQSLVPSSQFVMITHNPNSMEIADYIYGVTMEEAGVSKIVSVDLKNIKSNNQISKAVS